MSWLLKQNAQLVLLAQEICESFAHVPQHKVSLKQFVPVWDPVQPPAQSCAPEQRNLSRTLRH